MPYYEEKMTANDVEISIDRNDYQSMIIFGLTVKAYVLINDVLSSTIGNIVSIL